MNNQQPCEDHAWVDFCFRFMGELSWRSWPKPTHPKHGIYISSNMASANTFSGKPDSDHLGSIAVINCTAFDAKTSFLFRFFCTFAKCRRRVTLQTETWTVVAAFIATHLQRNGDSDVSLVLNDWLMIYKRRIYGLQWCLANGRQRVQTIIPWEAWQKIRSLSFILAVN